MRPCPGEWLTMTVDEYEVIRLVDLEEMTQEEAAGQMGVARTTAQAIYNAARKKLAHCLINGKHLRIQGGDVELCEGRNRCHRSNCPGRRCGRQKPEEPASS